MKQFLSCWVGLFFIPVFVVFFGYSFTTLSLTSLNPMEWLPFVRFTAFIWFVWTGLMAASITS